MHDTRAHAHKHTHGDFECPVMLTFMTATEWRQWHSIRGHNIIFYTPDFRRCRRITVVTLPVRRAVANLILLLDEVRHRLTGPIFRLENIVIMCSLFGCREKQIRGRD